MYPLFGVPVPRVGFLLLWMLAPGLWLGVVAPGPKRNRG